MHSDFNNFDQFVSQITGAGTINTSHGIILQEYISNLEDQSNSSTEISNFKLEEN